MDFKIIAINMINDYKVENFRILENIKKNQIKILKLQNEMKLRTQWTETDEKNQRRGNMVRRK